jgi:hypothetical protein
MLNMNLSPEGVWRVFEMGPKEREPEQANSPAPRVHRFLDSIETQIERLHLWCVVSLLLINASLTQVGQNCGPISLRALLRIEESP